MKKILFICKFNHTRSQIARSLFEKLNKNKEFKADSAGVVRAEMSPELREATKFIFKKHNLKFKKQKYLQSKLLYGQDQIIIVADDVPPSLFNSQKKQGIKIIKLKIKDGHKYKEKTKKERLEKVYLDVERKIKKFIKELK